jgi:4-hydroxy-tetrahydrodipicolinate synthase
MAPIPSDGLDLSGYTPSIPTPFDASDNIDRPAFVHLCQRQIDSGAAALVVGGITGEASTLSPTEHRVLIHIAVEVARRRVPVIAGAGSNSTAHAIELTRDAERLGADAVLSVVPYYNKPSQQGMIAHFNAIRRSTGLPIILHDIPSRCAAGLTDASIAQLSADRQFIGLKDSTGDVTRPVRLRLLTGPNFRLLSGHDVTAFAFMALGGDGCISVTSNAIPQICRAIVVALQEGDMDRAQRLSVPVAVLSGVLAQESDPVPLKYALSLLGLIAPKVRLPLVDLSASDKGEVAAAMLQIRQDYPETRMLDQFAATAHLDHKPLRISGRI